MNLQDTNEIKYFETEFTGDRNGQKAFAANVLDRVFIPFGLWNSEEIKQKAELVLSQLLNNEYISGIAILGHREKQWINRSVKHCNNESQKKTDICLFKETRGGCICCGHYK